MGNKEYDMIMTLQEVFIGNLKRIRKEKKITQEKLAELCETDACYIGQIETLRRFPSINMIEKFADALEIEPYELFKDSGTHNSVKRQQKIRNILNTEFDKMISDVLQKYL